MEAGNRCFDQNVPEEINRKIVDHISDINLPYTENARKYLLSEGIRKDFIFKSGSPIKEILKFHEEEILKSEVLTSLGVKQKDYIVVSIHREENIDNKENFNNIMSALDEVQKKFKKKIIFSTHPRTKPKIENLLDNINSNIKFIKPLGFFDYISLQLNSYVTLSDSGTLAEESSILKFPAVSIRTSTERPEAFDSGTFVLGSLNKKDIINSVELVLNLKLFKEPEDYNLTNCSDKVIKIIQSYTSIVNKEVWKK